MACSCCHRGQHCWAWPRYRPSLSSSTIEPVGLTGPLQVPGKDFHDQVGLMLKIVDSGRVVEVMRHGKVLAAASFANAALAADEVDRYLP